MYTSRVRETYTNDPLLFYTLVRLYKSLSSGFSNIHKPFHQTIYYTLTNNQIPSSMSPLIPGTIIMQKMLSTYQIKLPTNAYPYHVFLIYSSFTSISNLYHASFTKILTHVTIICSNSNNQTIQHFTLTNLVRDERGNIIPSHIVDTR